MADASSSPAVRAGGWAPPCCTAAAGRAAEAGRITVPGEPAAAPGPPRKAFAATSVRTF